MKPRVIGVVVDTELDATWTQAVDPGDSSDPVCTYHPDCCLCARLLPPTHPYCSLSRNTFFHVDVALHRSVEPGIVAARNQPVVLATVCAQASSSGAPESRVEACGASAMVLPVVSSVRIFRHDWENRCSMLAHAAELCFVVAEQSTSRLTGVSSVVGSVLTMSDFVRVAYCDPPGRFLSHLSLYWRERVPSVPAYSI